MREPAVVSTPLVEMTSLSAIGMLVPSGSADRPEVRVQLAVALADRVEVRGVQLGGRDLAALDEPDRVLRGEPQTVSTTRAHAVGGTRNMSPSRGGRVREHVVERQRLVRLVLGPRVDEVERMRRRRHVREIELRDLRDGVEDRAELVVSRSTSSSRQVEAREPRHVEHLIPRDRHADPSFQNARNGGGPSWGPPPRTGDRRR